MFVLGNIASSFKKTNGAGASSATMKDYPEIGERLGYGGYRRLFGTPRTDRRHHTYIIGRTGLGKTTLLRNLIKQDIERGDGVAVLDPHGDLAEELLDDIPSSRTNDLVYFNPADIERPLGFNLFTQGGGLESHLVASTIVAAFKHLWHDSWGPRLEYILVNTIQTLIEVGEVSIVSVQQILANERYRAWITGRLQNSTLKSFWLNEFERYDPRFRTEAIAPIQNKIGRLVTSPILRNILGQVRSTFDLRFMMDNRRIFIANLSKGKIGEDNSNLLGSLLATALHLGAMQRAEQPEEERKDFYLYLDEFHNFGGDTFISTLSEARKYRLSLILSHQYLDQLSSPLRSAVTGNVGTLICFGISPEDAERLKTTLHPYTPDLLVSLGRGQVCIRTLEDGEHVQPFKAIIPPPEAPRYRRKEKLIAYSRERFGIPKDKIEEKLKRYYSI